MWPALTGPTPTFAGTNGTFYSRQPRRKHTHTITSAPPGIGTVCEPLAMGPWPWSLRLLSWRCRELMDVISSSTCQKQKQRDRMKTKEKKKLILPAPHPSSQSALTFRTVAQEQIKSCCAVASCEGL